MQTVYPSIICHDTISDLGVFRLSIIVCIISIYANELIPNITNTPLVSRIFLGLFDSVTFARDITHDKLLILFPRLPHLHSDYDFKWGIIHGCCTAKPSSVTREYCCVNWLLIAIGFNWF